MDDVKKHQPSDITVTSKIQRPEDVSNASRNFCILTREADMGFNLWQVVTLSTGKKALMLPNDTPEVVGSFAPRRKWSAYVSLTLHQKWVAGCFMAGER